MLDHITPENLLFLDIETVPGWTDWSDVPENMQKLWEKKAAIITREDEDPVKIFNRAGIYAEFGRIVCISVGFVFRKDEGVAARIKSFAGKDEKKILQEFSALLETYSGKKDFSLCAHNGKEFDFPYIARRMLINGLKLPEVLDIAGKKPWEVRFVDTMELWKFGDFKNYTSLELLASVFDIPTPKDDIDGSMVSKVFYEDDDLDRIVKYCEKDVLTIIQLMMKYKGKSLLDESMVEIV